MIIQLQGKHDVYEFNPDSKSDIIAHNETYSTLYRARAISTNSFVTIKHILNSQLITNNEHAEIIYTILTSINQLHTGIQQTIDIIVNEQGYFLVKEYLQGVDLKTIIFDPDYPHMRHPITMLSIALETSKVLEVIHQNGIIHRNITPSNIFILTDEYGKINEHDIQIKLLDFEKAQVFNNSILRFEKLPFAHIYSPPEQVLRFDNLIKPCSDMYHLGVCIYESIIRTPAYDHQDKNLVYNLQVSFPLVRNPKIPKELFAFILKATHKQKFTIPPSRIRYDKLEILLSNAQKDRIGTATEFRIGLEKIIDNLIAKNRKKTKGNFLKKIFGKK